MSTPSRMKALWRVSSPHTAPVTLRATDWISALGAALHQLGWLEQINRMACERLPNGDLIINDLTHDSRYIVQKLAGAADLPPLEADEEITELGRRSPVGAVSTLPEPGATGMDSNEILALGDATERTDPYAGWGMSLVIDPSEDIPSDEKPIIESYRPGRWQSAPPALEDVSVFEADDLSELPDESTITSRTARRSLSDAFKLIRRRRGSTP